MYLSGRKCLKSLGRRSAIANDRSKARQAKPVDDKSLTRAEHYPVGSRVPGGSGRGKRPESCALKILWIRTAAGPDIGFGHLRRSLILADMVSDCAQSVFLLDEHDSWSHSQIIQAGWNHSIYPKDGSWPELDKPDAILIDTREVQGLDRFVTEARSQRVPVVSIHDLGLSPLASDVVIDGSVAPEQRVFPLAETIFHTGTRFLVLDPSCKEIHRRPKRIRDSLESVLVSLGGGDSHRFFPKILQGLLLWGRSLDVIGLPGYSDWGQLSLASQNWGPLNFRWAEKGETTCGIAYPLDVAITAGGLSAFEVLCAGTPLLALSHDDLQARTVCELAKADACIQLGLLESFEPEQLPPILGSLEANRVAREMLSKRGRRIVDGSGADRVSHILRDVIAGSP